MLRHYWTHSIWDGAARRWRHSPPKGRPLLLFAAGKLPLLRALLGWCTEHRWAFALSEPDSPAIVLMPYQGAVIDRDYVGEEAWQNFCHYRNLAMQPVPPELQVEFSDLAAGVDPLVIVADREARVLAEVNPFNLFFASPSQPKVILELLDQWDQTGISRGDPKPRLS